MSHLIGKKVKVLDLFAGIGGNRKLWPETAEVTAVEINPEIAAIYADLFPNDRVMVGDAHAFLEAHFSEYDFIWSSPPCQSHSRLRQHHGVKALGVLPIYPDMRLYQEIIFLQHNAVKPWIVENVIPYYDPLITGKIVGRHMMWANFPLPIDTRPDSEGIRANFEADYWVRMGLDIRSYPITNKRQILRNCVDPRTGKAVFDAAMSGAVQTKILDVKEAVTI